MDALEALRAAIPDAATLDAAVAALEAGGAVVTETPPVAAAAQSA